MQLLLVMQQQVPKLMRDREILPDWRVAGVNPDDSSMLVAIKEPRHVSRKRVNVDARSF